MDKNNFDVRAAYESAKQTNTAEMNDRYHLGMREIQTFKLLAQESGIALPRNTAFLDLGCADRYLEKACVTEGWSYSGLDYSDVNFEVDRLPLKDASIDVAASLAVIEHLRDPANFLSEIYRCLRPGGVVYLSTPNFRLDWKNFYNDPTHVRPYTPESIEQLLKLQGYDSVKSYPGLRCKDIAWYRGKHRFLKAYYLLPFRSDTRLPVPSFLKGHARSVFALGRKQLN